MYNKEISNSVMQSLTEVVIEVSLTRETSVLEKFNSVLDNI